MRKNTRAQSIIEYALILGIVAIALSAMQLYFRRSLQAAIKLAADDIGSQRDGDDSEIDPLRGEKRSRSSEIHKYASGAIEGTPGINAQATERERTYEDGGVRRDFYKVYGTEGVSTYSVSKEE